MDEFIAALPIILKLLLMVLTIVGFVTYDVLFAEPINQVRILNLIFEFTLSMIAGVLFLLIDEIKDKRFYKYLAAGLFFVFLSMFVDGLDQIHKHGEVYTAIWEKATLLMGFVLTFIGIQKWVVAHNEMNQKLLKQAHTDELTGLFNRRGILRKFEALDAVAEKKHLDISFIIADLDDFKVINDTLGHVAGDDFLADMGKMMLSLADEATVLGRWGGEEFAVCLLGSDINDAHAFSEKIRHEVAKIPLPLTMNKHSVTVSLGVSQKTRNESLIDAIKRADRSLYAAKIRGKNQSVVS